MGGKRELAARELSVDPSCNPTVRRPQLGGSATPQFVGDSLGLVIIHRVERAFTSYPPEDVDEEQPVAPHNSPALGFVWPIINAKQA
jgi:hypothetical protein